MRRPVGFHQSQAGSSFSLMACLLACLTCLSSSLYHLRHRTDHLASDPRRLLRWSFVCFAHRCPFLCIIYASRAANTGALSPLLAAVLACPVPPFETDASSIRALAGKRFLVAFLSTRRLLLPSSSSSAFRFPPPCKRPPSTVCVTATKMRISTSGDNTWDTHNKQQKHRTGRLHVSISATATGLLCL